MLKLKGIVKEESQETAFKPAICPRCKEKNTPGTKLCLVCGSALDLKFAVELDQRKENIKEKIDTLTEEVAKSPEVVDKLLKALDILRNEKKE